MTVKLLFGRNFVTFFPKPQKKVEIENKNFLVALVNVFCLFNLKMTSRVVVFLFSYLHFLILLLFLCIFFVICSS